jgi:hypothetical protein
LPTLTFHSCLPLFFVSHQGGSIDQVILAARTALAADTRILVLIMGSEQVAQV